MRAAKTPPALRVFRLLRFALHVAQGLATMVLVFPFIRRPLRNRLTRRWANGVLDAFNVNCAIAGEAPGPDASRVIFVANHVSWLDPALLMALRPAHFVAKSEIRSWPVLGWLAAKAGTLFIERVRRQDIGRVNRTVGEILEQGECVALFPEATTSDGTLLKPFNSSLLQPAVEARAMLWPVALRYRHADGSANVVPAFVDNMTFSSSVRRILGEPEIRAEAIFLTPIPAAGHSRRELALLAEQAIAGALGLPLPRRQPGTPGGPPA